MTEAAKNAPVKTARKSVVRYAMAALRHTAGWVLTVATIVLLLAAVGLLFLQTDRGLRVLEGAIARFASTPDMQIALEIESFSALQVQIPAVVLSDADGVFLTVENIDLRVNPITYVVFSPVIDSLVVGKIDLIRLPETPENATAETSDSKAGLPDFIAEIRRFDVHDMRTGAAIYGREENFSLQSRAQLSSTLRDNNISILLQSKSGDAKANTHVDIKLAPADSGDMELSAVVRDAAGGILTRLLGLPQGYDIDVTTQAKGTAEDWQGRTDLRLGDALKGKIDWQQKKSALAMQADLTGPRGIFVKGQAQLPVLLDPPRVDMRGRLSGQFTSTLDLKSLTLLMGLDDHRLTGRADIKVVLAGSLAAPDITGAADLQGGSYENLLLGTRLTQIDARIEATRDTVQLTRFNAQTPPKGSRVSAQGKVLLKDMLNPAFDFAVQLEKAQVLQQQNTDARVSGNIFLRGDAKSAQVSGDILLNSVDVYLANFGSGSTANMLNIKEVNLPQHLKRSRRERPTASTGDYDVKLDLRIEAPRFIRVTAQGLDTEWKTKLHITGTVNDPVINGYLKLLNGKYEIFNARLNLTTGNVYFTGADSLNPDLDIKGNVKGREVTANIAVSGTAQNPKVELTSTPALPQDEILAKVLFNKSVDELSPIEMIKVAEVIGVMTGTIKAGPDPLTKLRKKIGIDTLSVNRDDATGDTSVSVGKQLSDGVYISVDQGVNTEGSAVKLEVDVTPSIQVETRLGNDNDSSVGINWKKDY